MYIPDNNLQNIDRRVVHVILIRNAYKRGQAKKKELINFKCTQNAKNSVNKGISKLRMMDFSYHQHLSHW